MTINLIHVSDIHFGSGESHGRINPETGLNIRFEDFVRALEKTVDYCIARNVDVFLFSGDAYRNACPEPIYQKMFAKELKRLCDHGIKIILVVGNHDQILKSTESHAMSVFQSLEIPGITIVDRPVAQVIATKSGDFQLVGLPHITRNNLMTIAKYADLQASQIDDVLVNHVQDMLRSYFDELDESLPAVATAHMSLDRAIAGIERDLLIGYTLTFPTEMFIDPRIDYVAMGHIHKYQVIRKESPAIVYAGSLERVDFGEAHEDKGFVHVKIKRGKTEFEFHSIQPRPFVTVEANLKKSQNPTETLIKKVRESATPGCVLRIRYRIDQSRLDEVSVKDVLEAAGDCLSA
ncbi:MAG: exonuclease SbcCD subunit D, partial [Cyanobacteria bacterium]|nr:exonuclease SbcCD subunit D [Cyanobacteriota bacterium]